MIERSISRREWATLLIGCIAASISAAVWSWRNGAMLNYGDAVAHLHIARRVIDAHEPGLSQLGSVWLPLPHLLLIPFVAIFPLWANGLAGTLASSVVWLISCVGLYKLARTWLQPTPAALALAFFVLNPNLLYLQTTAMTEPLFLCEMIWASVLLVEWRASLDTHPRSGRYLYAIALVFVAAIFTRYDGWILALLAWFFVAIILVRRKTLSDRRFWIASCIIALAPIIWFSYNGIVFGDWLDFMRGPYSAKAIELRTAQPGGPPHPGWHNPWVSLLFFVKAAEMDASAAAWGNTLLVLSLLANVLTYFVERSRAFAWTLWLWLPVPFYAYSVSYGSVPIFLPAWWPHSFYNTRYGLELLPAFALAVGLIARFTLALIRDFKPSATKYAAAALAILIAANAWSILRSRPLVYVEGTKNIESRRGYEIEIPPVLRSVLATHPHASVLMNTSVYPQIVAFSGIPLHQTINESDRWIYAAALDSPAAHAAIIVAFQGDDIDRAVHAHPDGLTLVHLIHPKGLPPVSIYTSAIPPPS